MFYIYSMSISIYIWICICICIYTLPETNIFAPENQWLEDDPASFLGSQAYFQGFREGIFVSVHSLLLASQVKQQGPLLHDGLELTPPSHHAACCVLHGRWRYGAGCGSGGEIAVAI